MLTNDHSSPCTDILPVCFSTNSPYDHFTNLSPENLWLYGPAFLPVLQVWYQTIEYFKCQKTWRSRHLHCPLGWRAAHFQSSDKKLERPLPSVFCEFPFNSGAGYCVCVPVSVPGDGVSVPLWNTAAVLLTPLPQGRCIFSLELSLNIAVTFQFVSGFCPRSLLVFPNSAHWLTC